jgi:hypothetical protein
MSDPLRLTVTVVPQLDWILLKTLHPAGPSDKTASVWSGGRADLGLKSMAVRGAWVSADLTPACSHRPLGMLAVMRPINTGKS